MKNSNNNLSRRAYKVTRSFLKYLNRNKARTVDNKDKKLKVAFIHSEKKIFTGAHHINQLMAEALADRGVKVNNFFPKRQLANTPTHLKGIANILFFHSLLEHKEEILKNHIIQGTTYTPLPFLSFDVPVVCHFGSTIRGYLSSVPDTRKLPEEERGVFKELVKLGIIPEFDLKTFRPMEDVADVEAVVASQATACIATSQKVKSELVSMSVPETSISVIPNAIEDYWFKTERPEKIKSPHLVFLGRLGGDVFTLKLKGFSRLVNFYRSFPDVPKTTVCMTTNRKLKDWLRVSFPNHYMFTNLRKDLIPGALAPLYGSIIFLSSRYEGFSLSVIEGMSQGLIPIAYSVGVVPEVIKNGVNGYIVQSQEEAYSYANELLGDEAKRLRMAEASKISAQEFRSSKIADQLINLYKRLRREHKNESVSQGENDVKDYDLNKYKNPMKAEFNTKSILVDAIDCFVGRDGKIFEQMHSLLESYPNRKIILTGADDQQFKKWGLDKMPYSVFSLKHNPEKTDPRYFDILLRDLGLKNTDVIYFEHNLEAVKCAESAGITSYFYDNNKKDLNLLRNFLDSNLKTF